MFDEEGRLIKAQPLLYRVIASRFLRYPSYEFILLPFCVPPRVMTICIAYILDG